MHRRRIDLRRAVGEPAIARLALLGRAISRLISASSVALSAAVDLDGERLRQIERAGIDLGSGSDGARVVSPVIRLWSISPDLPVSTDAVGGDPLAGRDEHSIAGHERMRREAAAKSHPPRSAWPCRFAVSSRFCASPRARTRMHSSRIAADQQEEQQRDCGIEIDCSLPRMVC